MTSINEEFENDALATDDPTGGDLEATEFPEEEFPELSNDPTIEVLADGEEVDHNDDC